MIKNTCIPIVFLLCFFTVNLIGQCTICQEVGEDLPDDVCYYWDPEFGLEDNT